jgi:transposase-like protein
MRSECKVPEAVLRRGLAAGRTYADIAREHRHEPHAIRQRCRDLGLKSARRPRATAPSEALLRMALALEGVPVTRIAESLGCSESLLRATAKRLGLPTGEAGRAALREARR